MGSHKKTKVLYLVLEMDLGGLQKIVNLMIQGISKDNFVPYLVCLDRGGMFFDQAARHCAESHILARKPGLFDPSLFRQLLKIVRGNGIDVIHSNNGCSSYAALVGWLAGVRRVVHTDHGRLVPDRRGAIIEDRVASHFLDRVVGVSSELTEYMRTTIRIRAEKLRTIVNGVDDQAFHMRDAAEGSAIRENLGFSAADRIIGTVCRLDPIKNVGFMISCMPDILARIPTSKLAIVGDGPIRGELARHAERLGVDANVCFLGPRKDPENVMPAFDVYACSSLSEGTSMTILEAMSCGLPIVASAVGGNPRLVNDTNGILFELDDRQAFINALVGLLTDDGSRLAMGRRSRQRVEGEFSLKRMIDQYENMYLERD